MSFPRRTTWATDTNFSDPGTDWDATPTREEPPAGVKASGVVPDDPLPAQYINWVLGNQAEAISRALSASIKNYPFSAKKIFKPSDSSTFVFDGVNDFPYASSCFSRGAASGLEADWGITFADDYDSVAPAFHYGVAYRINDTWIPNQSASTVSNSAMAQVGLWEPDSAAVLYLKVTDTGVYTASITKVDGAGSPTTLATFSSQTSTTHVVGSTAIRVANFSCFPINRHPSSGPDVCNWLYYDHTNVTSGSLLLDPSLGFNYTAKGNLCATDGSTALVIPNLENCKYMRLTQDGSTFTRNYETAPLAANGGGTSHALTGVTYSANLSKWFMSAIDYPTAGAIEDATVSKVWSSLDGIAWTLAGTLTTPHGGIRSICAHGDFLLGLVYNGANGSTSDLHLYVSEDSGATWVRCDNFYHTASAKYTFVPSSGRTGSIPQVLSNGKQICVSSDLGAVFSMIF